MTTPNLKPVIFLAFANEQDNRARYLRNLPEEARRLRQTLDQAAQRGLCEIIERPNATLQEILDVFQDARYRHRIAMFHYGGHADGYRLLLESASGVTAAADAGGLVAFLGRQNGFQLVFLNGCSTQPQVEGLLAAGVPAVIATAQAIDDAVAMEFAARFYHGLASGVALQPAYDQAAAALQAVHGSQNPRGLYWGQGDQPADRWPWDFYLKAGARSVEAWSLPQAAGDYLFGLPELPPLDLPPSPFRHLYWFEREHAPLFFGREQVIRELYQRITSPETAPLILLYGQSGVGKSSLLAAGLLPRLERDYAICYQRRDSTRGLLGNLSSALQMEAGAISFGQRWRELEQAGGRPLVIILDQVEEVFTRPLAGADEFKSFLAALNDIFVAIEQRPRGKLILAFRKEWLAEIEQRLNEQRLPLAKIFLERLDYDDIVRVVRGPVQTPRLQTQYGLTVADDLPDLIAGDLLADPESPIAPTLQILLTKLWAEATKENPDHPYFSVELYQRLKKEGILLADFLNQQLDHLRTWRSEVETSGLALDVLAYHTTPLGTASQHNRQKLAETYAHQAELLPHLVQKCQDLYLLVDLSKNRPDQVGASQLAHDTLAPLVRRQFEESDRPGQRARRILENRTVEWAEGQAGASLDEADLTLVEQGQAGMRTWTGAEERLIQASRKERDKRGRNRIFRWVFSIFAISLLVVAAIVAEQRRQDAEVARSDANAAAATAEARRQEAEQLTQIARSRQLAAQSTNELNQNNYETAILLAIESGRITDTLEAFSSIRAVIAHPWHSRRVFYNDSNFDWVQATWSQDERRILTSSRGWKPTVRVWDTVTGRELLTLEDADSATWSRDENRILTTNTDGTVRVWDAASGQELLQLKGHTGWVNQATWNRDESRILTTGCDRRDQNYNCLDGTARIWDAASGQELVKLAGYTATWNKDESRILTCSDDGTVRVWDAASGRELLTLEGHTKDVVPTKGVVQATWSQDESRILTHSHADNTVRVWDAATGQELFKLEGANQAAWNQDKSRVLTSSYANTPRVWDAATGQELFKLAGYTSAGLTATWNQDESRILTIGGVPDNSVRVWDAVTGRELVKLEGVDWAIWSQDKSRFLTGSNDGKAQIWDMATGHELVSFEGHTGQIGEATWSKDENRILTSSFDGTARVWDVVTGHELVSFEGHTGQIREATWNKGESRILTRSDDGTARVWDAASGRELLTLEGHTGLVMKAIWGQDERRILTTGYDGTVRVWDTVSGRELLKFGGHTGQVMATWSHDERRILTTGYDTAQIWDAASGRELLKLEGKIGSVDLATWSQDDRRILTAGCDFANNGVCANGTVRVWDAATGRELLMFEGHTGPIKKATWSQDESRILTAGCDRGNNYSCVDGSARVWDAATGQELLKFKGRADVFWEAEATWNRDESQILTGSADGTVRVWDTVTGRELLKLEGHTYTVYQATWNQDENRILTRSGDGTARVWDTTTGQELLKLEGHSRPVREASWSQDESRILTSSDDGTARVWDAVTGRELFKLEGVNQATWSQDGQRILTSNQDGTARIWYTYMTDLIEAACRYAPRNMTGEEWARLIGGPYRPTCPDVPVSLDATEALISQGVELVQAGQMITAVNQLVPMMAAPPISATNPEATVYHHLALALARDGQVEAAIAALEKAQALNPTLKITVSDWNILCRWGSLWQQAALMQDACDQAVSRPGEDEVPGYRDSRGINRALLGDLAGAIEDFSAYVEYYRDKPDYAEGVAQREGWIEALRAGKNPFDEATLASLRGE